MPSSIQSDISQVVQILLKADPTAPAQLTAELAKLQHQMEVIAVTAPHMGWTMEETAKSILEVQQRVDLLQMALASTVSTTIKDVGALSRGFLEFSRGFEDFMVAGPLGALNNIPGVVYNIGQAFGVATPQLSALVTAVSIGSTVAYVAWRNWDSLSQAVGLSTPKIISEAEAMKELGKQTERTAAETEKLIAYKEREAQIEKMRRVKTDQEKAQAEAVDEAVGGNFEAVRKGLIDASRDELIRTNKEARDAQDAVEERVKALKGFNIPGGPRTERTPEELAKALQADPEYQKLITERDQKIIKAAEQVIGAAAVDPGKLNQLMRAATRAPGAFPGGIGFAQQLWMGTEAGQKFNRAAEEAAEAREQADEIHIERRKAADAAKKKADREQKEKDRADQATADAEKGISDILHGTDVKDATKAARDKKAAEAAAKRAQAAVARGTSAEYRRAIADIRSHADESPEARGAALFALRESLNQNAGNLNDVVVKNIRQQIETLYRSIERQADRQDVRTHRTMLPAHQIESAAAPMINTATALGAPHREASSVIKKQISILLNQNYSLMEAQMAIIEDMNNTTMTAMQWVAQLQARQRMIEAQARRAGGMGGPSQQTTIRPGP